MGVRLKHSHHTHDQYHGHPRRYQRKGWRNARLRLHGQGRSGRDCQAAVRPVVRRLRREVHHGTRGQEERGRDPRAGARGERHARQVYHSPAEEGQQLQADGRRGGVVFASLHAQQLAHQHDLHHLHNKQQQRLILLILIPTVCSMKCAPWMCYNRAQAPLSRLLVSLSAADRQLESLVKCHWLCQLWIPFSVSSIFLVNTVSLSLFSSSPLSYTLYPTPSYPYPIYSIISFYLTLTVFK